MRKELMRKSTPLKNSPKQMKVKNCFVSGNKVFLIIENVLRIINYNQLYDELNGDTQRFSHEYWKMSLPEDIEIELFNKGPEGHV